MALELEVPHFGEPPRHWNETLVIRNFVPAKFEVKISVRNGSALKSGGGNRAEDGVLNICILTLT